MKTYRKTTARLLALLLVASALLSAASCAEKTPTLSSDGMGGYMDSKTEISYCGAPSAYEARAYVSAEVVAENDGVAFYAVEGTSSAEWLWSPDFAMLLYSRDVTLPTLENFETSGFYVYVEEDGALRTVADETDASKLEEILDLFENGEAVPYSGKKASYTFHLKLYSETYSWLLYNLLYVQYAEDYIVYETDENGEEIEINYGKDFLYDRSEGRCVAVGDALQCYIDSYYRNTEAEGEA